MPELAPLEIGLVAQVREQLSAIQNEQLSDLDVWRFVVARKKSVPKSISMITSFIEWYDKPLVGADNLTPRNILELPDPDEPVYRSYFFHSNQGHSKTGCPLYWEKTGVCSVNFPVVNQSISTERMVIRHVRQQEYVFRDRCSRASAFYGRAVTKQICVFDLHNLSYSLHTNAISAFRQCLSIDEANYPERLDHLIMFNAPWFFTALWSMLRAFVDPVTAEKIVIVGHDFLPTLRKHIDDSQIPAELGGQRSDFGWTFPENRVDPDEMLAAACPLRPQEPSKAELGTEPSSQVADLDEKK